MQTLEAYLSDGIHRDREDIAAIETVLLEIAETVVQNYNEMTNDWPYEIDRHASDGARSFSQSTTAMMIHAIDLLLEAVPSQTRQPYPFKLSKQVATRLSEKRAGAFKALVAEVMHVPKNEEEKQANPQPPSTWSGTYGTDDPLTLSFLSDILPIGIEDDLRAYARKSAVTFLALDPVKDVGDFFDFLRPAPEGKAAQASRPLTNAFVPLRVIRACHLLGVQDPDSESTYLRYFESTLHDQLSYSAIPDSRFDPAELIFCLEAREEGPSLLVVVMPLTTVHGRRANGLPCAILFARDLERVTQLSLAAFQRHYGLTLAQTALVREIIKADGVAATAARLGITYATARSHLQQVYDKTGGRRQAELVSLALQWLGDSSACHLHQIAEASASR